MFTVFRPETKAEIEESFRQWVKWFVDKNKDSPEPEIIVGNRKNWLDLVKFGGEFGLKRSGSCLCLGNISIKPACENWLPLGP